MLKLGYDICLFLVNLEGIVVVWDVFKLVD